MTFGSLFAGIGGLDLGLERAGMETRWQVEIDPYCQQVLAKHWPDCGRWDDIRTFPPPPTEDWKVDLICGGFPCQDISYAGQGAGLAGARSGLVFEALRVVRELRPRYVLLENVAALLSRGLDRVLGELAAIGFDAEWHCIPAAAVGAPHIRDRVFVIGIRSWDTDCNHDHPICTRSQQDTITKGTGGRQTSIPGNPQVSANASGVRCDAGRAEKPLQGHWMDGHEGWWAIEPDVGRVANGVPARMDRLRGLGNAVVPQVAEFIGRQIMKTP